MYIFNFIVYIICVDNKYINDLKRIPILIVLFDVYPFLFNVGSMNISYHTG